MGDGTLVEFSSVVDAVMCALAIQRAVKAEAPPGGKGVILRIGINLGDVIIDGDDIYGDGVNVAARLEGSPSLAGYASHRSSTRASAAGSTSRSRTAAR